MSYTVLPGLYALGQPDENSPVCVTANYKMSFDRLREALPGRSAWLLVLDTNGINVWCAAGKGTFGTAELANRVALSGLANVVTHRRLILPQLSAPGVSAREVKRLTGFKVVYGPVEARDLPRFLDSGMKATVEMRRKSFPLLERAVLVPVELVATLKPSAIIVPLLFILAGFGKGGFWSNVLHFGSFAVLAYLCAILAGAVAAPILLPWIPGRAFAVKGAYAGLATALVLSIGRGFSITTAAGFSEMMAWFLLIPAVSAYLAMNFTGASTYTSLSGVRKEMRWAVPLEIAAAVVGVGLWFGSRFM